MSSAFPSCPPLADFGHLRRAATSSAAAIAAVLSAGAAAAQDGSTTTVELDPISVVGDQGPGAGPNLNVRSSAGSRLGLTPLETPASVDIISGKVIRERGQNTLAEAVTQNATGFSYMGAPGNGFVSFSSRGFTGVTSVTTLYDGVRLYPGQGTVTFPFDTWTVAQIDVLRGPASVLYGEGAIGGAINVIPKKPLFDSRRNEARVFIGSNGQAGLAAGSAGPINENLAYSLDVSGVRGDGWMDRGEYKSLAFSGALAWRPTDALTFTLSHDGGYNEPSRYFGTPLRTAGVMEKSWIRQNYNVRDSDIWFNDNITQLRAEWAPNEAFSLRAVGYYVTSNRYWQNAESYRWNAATGLIDRPTGNWIAIKQEQEQAGGRVDATFRTTPFGMANETVVGFDANNFRFSRLNNTGYAAPKLNPSLTPFGFDPGFWGTTGVYNREYRSTTRQYSLFLDNRLKVTDTFSVVAGLRYDNPEVDYRNLRNGSQANATLDSIGWRVGAIYEPIRNLAFYAQYSEASDPVTSILSLPPASAGYKLSSGQQVEVGVKQSLWDGRLEWTLAGYYIVKKDLLSRDPNNPAITQQVGQQSSRGVEASVGLELGQGWRIDANGTLLDARYDDFNESVGGLSVSRKGKTPAGAPEAVANLWVTWGFADQWKAMVGLQYVGKTYTSASNDYSRPEYALVNASLQWKPTDYATLDFRVKNLFDRTYAYAGGDLQWCYGAPRTAELSLHVRF